MIEKLPENSQVWRRYREVLQSLTIKKKRKHVILLASERNSHVKNLDNSATVKIQLSLAKKLKSQYFIKRDTTGPIWLLSIKSR